MKGLALGAHVAGTCCPVSKAFCRRKRAEGKSHKQAVLAVAVRRLDVLRALICDNRTFEMTPLQVDGAAG
ncbi:hypothetical protein AB0C81_12130 [Streptomyces roseoverticillatus]|uniref:hypothetical protein n=1 Tax=Streptomyces roseoverticillatus TaxID=66429 RepID=UPI0033F63AFB